MLYTMDTSVLVSLGVGRGAVRGGGRLRVRGARPPPSPTHRSRRSAFIPGMALDASRGRRILFTYPWIALTTSAGAAVDAAMVGGQPEASQKEGWVKGGPRTQGHTHGTHRGCTPLWHTPGLCV